MKAKDIMTARVVTVAPDTPVREIAAILVAEGVSAVPVVDASGVPVGIVSEGDLIGRDEEAREARRDWWLALAAAESAADMLTSLADRHRIARDVMASPVIAIDEETDAGEIARLLVSYRVKRVPVLRQGKLVGIVSRADLLRVLAAEHAPAAPPPAQSLFSRAFAGLDGHFGLHLRPASGPEGAPAPVHHASAQDFRQLIADHQHIEAQHRDEARRAAGAAHDKLVSDLITTHVSDEIWQTLMEKARLAAKAGEKEFLLLRFPSQLCSDGGRAINITEPDWPATLQGEAAELYLRWERELRPQGFHLAAQILNFPGGFPGDVGLFLIWA